MKQIKGGPPADLKTLHMGNYLVVATSSTDTVRSEVPALHVLRKLWGLQGRVILVRPFSVKLQLKNVTQDSGQHHQILRCVHTHTHTHTDVPGWSHTNVP